LSCPRNKHVFRCDQNGPPARRKEGAYPERYVTDEQRSRRPIFIATLWAAASWLFFRVARSSRIDLDMLVARALKNSQLTCGERHAYFGDRTLGYLDIAPSALNPERRSYKCPNSSDGRGRPSHIVGAGIPVGPRRGPCAYRSFANAQKNCVRLDSQRAVSDAKLQQNRPR